MVWQRLLACWFHQARSGVMPSVAPCVPRACMEGARRSKESDTPVSKLLTAFEMGVQRDTEVRCEDRVLSELREDLNGFIPS